MITFFIAIDDLEGKRGVIVGQYSREASMQIVSQKKVSLKNHTEINEKAIQEYIFDHPEVLNLGDLQPIKMEKIQPLGGRLDMLFSDEEDNRYEVELQLGPTDPSHIIRTLEYWDTEKKRYPQYDHTAVIIAEDITTRFQNVISLFNNQIPLIAIQMSATMTDDGNIALSFIKVMDKIERGTEEEEYAEPTDRVFWETKKSNKKYLGLTDKVFDALGERKEGYELKYNKFYIGLARNGVAKNFVQFVPHKSFLTFRIYISPDEENGAILENNGLDIEYSKRRRCYQIKLKDIGEFKDNSEIIMKMVDNAKEQKSAE